MQLVVTPPLHPALELALAHCRSGGVICCPTDTLYGLGGDGTSPDVVKKILEIKERSVQNPFSVIFSGWEMAKEYARLSDHEISILQKFTPGPFTFLLPAKRAIAASAGQLLGCRIPKSEFCLKLAQELGKPLISTSANLHGMAPPASIEEIDENILQQVSLVVDGGQCIFSKGSTIIDMPHGKIVRRGAGIKDAEKILLKLAGK